MSVQKDNIYFLCVELCEYAWVGRNLVVTGNFNADISVPDGNECSKTIVVVMVQEGLDNMAVHFLPCHNPWKRDSWTCIMLHHGQEVRS